MGPFFKKEAEKIAEELKATCNPKLNGMHDARVRRRRKVTHCVCTAVCGAGLGHNQKYDVWIKTEYDV